MLDIQPPEHTPHTWRDFFIHIATIVVGLVIAIGLEQTVLAIQHHHERNALIADMRQEAQSNIPVMEQDMNGFEKDRQVMLSYLAVLRQVKPINGMVTVTLPLKSLDRIGSIPSSAVWTVATANGKVALVPENLAEVYSRLNYEAQKFSKNQDNWLNALVNLEAIETQLGQHIGSGATLHLTVAERDELCHTLSQAAASFSMGATWTAQWLGADDAIVHGVQGRNQMDAYIAHRLAQLPQD